MSGAVISQTHAGEYVFEAIDAQAVLTPHAPAVFCDGASLTYQELVARSNQFAHRLIAAGAKPEMLIGLCVPRRLEMIVALLGILKAGAAFVPLDPAYPADRLAYMLEDSAAPLIVVHSSTADVTASHAAKIQIDDAAVAQAPVTRPFVALEPDNLAYVVYTSGSTGRPKGVMIEHASLSSFLRWTRSRFSAAQMSRVLCSSSLSFDVSYFEIFAPLVAGGAIVLVKDALALLGGRLAEPVTTLCTVASALAEIVRARAIPPTITTILQAGEYLPQALARDIYATSNVTELLNLCGATEDTVYSVSYLVPRDPQEDPPIGRAFLERFTYVVDENLHVVPRGTPGEICYGGPGVARGYLNRAELTAERFVANPFGDSPRMYRSGDIVVEGEDGEIRYRKRNDQQVKISGFRIELGEIEAVLREYPGVDQVAVLARDLGGHKTLAAYAVERNPGTLVVDEVQDYVRDRLPEYMVPSTLVLLDAMPYGPSGKLDREALQKLERRRPDMAYVEPRTPVEVAIAAQVAEMLGLDRVGLRDNFFVLGGQSLLAARLINDVSKIFAREAEQLDQISGSQALMTAFFVEPTVESLASAIQSVAVGDSISAELTQTAAATSGTPSASIKCIQQGDANVTPLFLFHGVIRGEAFYVWNLANGLGADQPLYSLAPHGYLGGEVPATIEEMAAEYLAEIRKIQPHGPYRFAGYCNGGLVAFEIARTLRARGERVEALVLISASARNVRFAKLYGAIEKLARVPGFSPARRRATFLKIRGRLLVLAERGGSGTPLGGLFNLMKRTTGTGAQHESLAPELETLSREERDERRYIAFLHAIDAYMPKPYDGEAALIWGDADSYGSADDPYNGWREVVRNVDLHLVPGDHNFLESRPELISDYVRELLRKAHQ